MKNIVIYRISSYSDFVWIDVPRNEQNVGVRLLIHHLLHRLLRPFCILALLLPRPHLVEFEVVLLEPIQHILHLLCLACPSEVGPWPFTEYNDVRRPQNRVLHPIKNLELHPFGIYQSEVDNCIIGKHIINLIDFNLFVSIGISARGLVWIDPRSTRIANIDYFGCLRVGGTCACVEDCCDFW